MACCFYREVNDASGPDEIEDLLFRVGLEPHTAILSHQCTTPPAKCTPYPQIERAVIDGELVRNVPDYPLVAESSWLVLDGELAQNVPNYPLVAESSCPVKLSHVVRLHGIFRGIKLQSVAIKKASLNFRQTLSSQAVTIPSPKSL